MIIETKEATVHTNMDTSKATQMSISAEGVAHIMQLLTNLYKDPELAVIREYYTNALDSHIEAKQSKPVEITLPDAYNPVFVIKDFGIGMSEASLREIYAKYGASTKRQTNDQVGAFGLGCKSALTITTQFTLVAVKDGMKSTAIISRTSEGINTVDIPVVVETEEENGVTVSIPIPNYRSFNQKAEHFFRFSKPELLTVQDRNIEFILKDYKEVPLEDMDFSIHFDQESNNYWASPSYVLVGNVPYELTSSELTEAFEKCDIRVRPELLNISKIFQVPIGSVDLAPSREGLRFTTRTQNMLKKMVRAYHDTILKQAQEEIDAVEDRGQVQPIINRWKNVTGETSFLWRGEKVVTRLAPTKKSPDDPVVLINSVEAYGDDDPSVHTTDWYLYPAKEQVVVTGYAPEDYRKVSRYLPSYVKSQDECIMRFSFVEDPQETFNNPWILENSNITFITGDEIIEKAKEYRKELRALRKKDPSLVRNKVAYQVIDMADGTISKVDYTDIPANTPHLYRDDMSCYSYGFKYVNALYGIGADSRYVLQNYKSTFYKSLKMLTDAPKVILVGGLMTRKAFEGRIKNSPAVKSNIEAKVKEMRAKITDEMKNHLALKGQHVYSALRMLNIPEDAPEIKDERIKNIIEKDEANYPELEELDKFRKMVSFFNFRDVETDIDTEPTEVFDVYAEYPLLSQMHHSQRGVTTLHFIVYINAIHDLNSDD